MDEPQLRHIMKERAGIQSVEVGFKLLQALAMADTALMLSDVAARSGMSAAKAHRYLVSFQRLGLVTQDAATTRYDLGPSALQLGLSALTRLDPVKLARERLPALMHDIGHTVALAVWGNQGPTIVHVQASPQALPLLRLGDVMPLLSSATGRCFAAYLPPATTAPMIRQALAQAQKMNQSELPSTLAQVKAMLQEVRTHQIARVQASLQPGVTCFCAPVFDADHRLVLGLVALGASVHFSDDYQGLPAQQLRQAAHQLSADLGHGLALLE